jgi:hypothetical protein
MLLSEIPLFDLIFAVEDKHGVDTHMVIEAVSKNPNKDVDDFDITDDEVLWWVEFKDDRKVLNSFEEVRTFFLEECEA